VRTDIDQPWVDAYAFALVHYRGVGALDNVTKLLLAYGEAAHQLDAPAKAAIGDLADAVTRLIRDGSPQVASALEFRNLDTGEQVDPEIFQATEQGRASVWAARVLNAAVSGDVEGTRATVAALVDDEAVSPGDLGVPMEALINGASMIRHEQQSREHWDRLRSWASGAIPPSWTLECYAGSHLGLPPSWQDFPCIQGGFSSPLDRDEAAADHVLTHRHAITWGAT
jgi:hypothetical protein